MQRICKKTKKEQNEVEPVPEFVQFSHKIKSFYVHTEI